MTSRLVGYRCWGKWNATRQTPNVKHYKRAAKLVYKVKNPTKQKKNIRKQKVYVRVTKLA